MTDIDELKAEIAKLREEVAVLRAGQVVHHYHHPPSPLQPYSPAPFPAWQPPWTVTCIGSAEMIAGYNDGSGARM